MNPTLNNLPSTESTGDLGSSNIRILPEEHIWEKRIDVGEKKTFCISVLRKEKMVFVETGGTTQTEDNQSTTHFTAIVPQKRSRLDTRLNTFWGLPFLKTVQESITSAPVTKSAATAFVFLFGEPNVLFHVYFVLAFIAVFTGVLMKIKQKALDLPSINSLIMQQVLMCLAIIIMNMVIQALMAPRIFADGAFIVKDLLVVWFALHNALISFSFLIELGVPFPKSWVERFEKIKGVIE